jgi:predicted Zn-ribbon and HTH transcriptional regulator
MKCADCGYEWVSRKENPKKCPKCQRWLPKWRNIKEVKDVE